MVEDLTPPEPESSGAGTKPVASKRSIRPGVALALLVAAALIVFVVQNDGEVPVTWWFVEVNGPLWAVIIVAAVAGAVLAEVIGWVAGRRRRRRRRQGP